MFVALEMNVCTLYLDLSSISGVMSGMIECVVLVVATRFIEN